MKSPQDMRIIQIDITNACIHKCSNCTRFCGHHKKPFFMDWETFQKAADSFEGYKGTVGIMGGEPTLHPQFERFVRYAQEHPYFPKGKNLLLKPTREFMQVVGRMEQSLTYISTEHGVKRPVVNGWGLWSALSGQYREHYELIQDTFNMQALNDHKNIMYHSPVLIRRQDLNIPDEEWFHIRDNCWAQDAWSATITPKGAFFCEIAGALDMLFDGPGGWPIEPGWWKRTPDQFGDQLKWCELCGICINTFTRDANEEMDDMSPWYYQKLRELGSPKVQTPGMANVLNIQEDGTIAESSKKNAREVRHSVYYDSWFSRFSKGNNWLNPTGITGVMIVERPEEVSNCAKTVQGCLDGVDRLVLGTADPAVFEELTKNFAQEEKVQIVSADRMTWGSILNKILGACDREHFLLLLKKEAAIAKGCSEYLKSFVMNPGVLLLGQDTNELSEEIGNGIYAIFSPKAHALKRAGFAGIARLDGPEALADLWDSNKLLPLCADSFTDGAYRIEPGVKYALYGAGGSGEYLFDRFDPDAIVCVVDGDPQKWGKDFHGHPIISPEELVQRKDDFDKIFVASNWYYEIKSKLLEMGFLLEDIVTTMILI